MDILFIYGTPDDGLGPCWITGNGKLEFGITGTCNIYPFLKDLQGKKHRYYLSGNKGKQSYSFSFFPNIVVSELSDPDSHVTAMSRAVEFCDQQKCHVFNHPRAVQGTRRDLMHQKLRHIEGLIMPKTVRFRASSPDDVRKAFAENELSYPVIFRKAGDHGGKSMTLLEDPSQIETAMYSYALNGGFFYATEFQDFKSPDGHYRKYRIAVVEGRPHLRHMIASDHWLIHASSRRYMHDKPGLREEEISLLSNFNETLRPKIIGILDQITPLMGLDYYGIDFSITAEGKMLIFEANPNMNIMFNKVKSPNIWEAPITNIAQDISRVIMKKAKAEASSKG